MNALMLITLTEDVIKAQKTPLLPAAHKEMCNQVYAFYQDTIALDPEYRQIVFDMTQAVTRHDWVHAANLLKVINAKNVPVKKEVPVKEEVLPVAGIPVKSAKPGFIPVKKTRKSPALNFFSTKENSAPSRKADQQAKQDCLKPKKRTPKEGTDGNID